ncbi:MAG: M48 family metallopeptidase [Bacteroidales bacterium]|nr:M48 family metallopeptidase [Bacteroidales bacterium]MBN2698371.1 M48 family metallopeptidase [Bacteroidales bacterium]
MTKITKNIIEYEDIGAVEYVCNRKARNFTIRINAEGVIRLTVPRFGTVRQGERFLLAKKGWVEQKLLEINRRHSGILLLEEGREIVVRGRSYIIKSEGKQGDPESAFWNVLLQEAGHILPGRVRELSGWHRLPFTSLRIKKMKSRWGSCSTKNAINLNAWLVLLPDHLMDYVILHELAHTIHKNHSAQFWMLLERLCNGRAKLLRKELRNYKIAYRIKNPA